VPADARLGSECDALAIMRSRQGSGRMAFGPDAIDVDAIAGSELTRR